LGRAMPRASRTAAAAEEERVGARVTGLPTSDRRSRGSRDADRGRALDRPPRYQIETCSGSTALGADLLLQPLRRLLVLEADFVDELRVDDDRLSQLDRPRLRVRLR